MKLSAAEDLKTELLLGLPPRLHPRRGGESPSIAIGIAPTSVTGDYRIAVRPRFARDLAGVREYLDDVTLGELDIRVTGSIVPAGTSVPLGASISRAAGGRTGSLGFFARRNRDGVIGFVSNNHILAAEDGGKDGDEIVHPGRADRRRALPRAIGHLDGTYPRLKIPRDVPVDCAFAVLVEGIECDPHEPLRPHTRMAIGDLAVTKVGRSTGRTHGRITAFALDRCRVDYRFGEVVFRSQIEIDSVSREPFSNPGDSGSLIVDEDRAPVGLLYSCSAAGGKFNCGLTYANPVGAVLDALGISILT